jgi:hypothetical protein
MIFYWLLFVSITGLSSSQENKVVVSEQVYEQAVKLTTDLPANITQAYQQYPVRKLQYDSLELLIAQAWPALANKMNQRSLILNSLAGIHNDQATRYIIPADQAFADYFIRQQEKMDGLERAFNQQVKSFYGKELYQKKGYMAVWDSVYHSRLQVMSRYREGLLKIVREDIAYLKEKKKMFTSPDESERMQYVEAEAKVLQKLVYLRDKWRRVVVEDGVEKVQFCKEHPESCVIENAAK